MLIIPQLKRTLISTRKKGTKNVPYGFTLVVRDRSLLQDREEIYGSYKP
jgi:hypothetical protein